MDVFELEIDHGIVLMFALTVFFLSSCLPGMGQALSIGDSWKGYVRKMALEFGITGIRPCYEGFVRRWVEEGFLVK
jgi:hypothetical protein